MKKIILLYMLLFSFAVYSQEESDFSGTFKLDFDLPGTSKITDVFYSDSLSGEESIGLGYSLSFEATTDVTGFLSLGLGLGYQFSRTGKLGFPIIDTTLTTENQKELKPNEGKFGYIPVYFLTKVTLYQSEIITPYFVGQIGYNLFYSDDNYKGDFLLNGNLFYGVGIAVDVYKNYQIGLTYKVNSGSVSHADEQFFNSKYSYLSLSLGLNFK